MGTNENVLQNMVLELRRGTLTLSVLSQLKEPEYGYSLVQKLQKKGLDIEQNTLYPLLRRLESQGLLVSNWSVSEKRPRKYYAISDSGSTALIMLKNEWLSLNDTLEELLFEDKGVIESERLD